MKISILNKNMFSFLALLLFIQWSYSQYTIPEKPGFIPPVIDSTNTLKKTELKNLYNKLKKYNDTTSTQIVIVIISSVKGENIGLLAPRWGHKWGIGQAEEDNGIFILLAKDDRKIWIAPGYGIEEKLTAGITGEIVRNVIIPEFKAGSYYRGLDKGTSALMEVLNGTYTADTVSDGEDGISLKGIISLLIIFIVVIISIAGRINRRNGGGRGGRSKGLDLTDILILTSLGKGSFGGSSSSGGGSFGGGFGGFGGGGGFSGGGAGGSW